MDSFFCLGHICHIFLQEYLLRIWCQCIVSSFNLDAITMLDVLYQIERLNKIKINRTAGLDVIRILDDLDFQDCVDAYYNSINNQ